ncbi:MAG: phosphatidylglycerophosphatase A [Melioribacteraceae bacterium]|nr:phosphatidylglycerophosphatase A [Melioribacteraceae bacterium]MCO6473224.1 phosphatidylglycerophosphatase A [Melioribacteraceae bacterium]MDD3558165.1 phosphatidylglycerophosphatase A [Melioribacteraceae bacterium]
MKINFIEKFIGSVFYTGYFPAASGTVSSLAALVIYLIPGFENPFIMLISISLFFVWGVNIATKFEAVYGKDPSQCTIDEMVGTWISLLFIPKTLVYVVISFILWRVLDILKPFPANLIEKIKGGWGIMLDDVASAFYVLLILYLIINLKIL